MSRPNSNPKKTEVEDEILDASELTEDDLADFCTDEETLDLIVERKGRKLRFVITVNPQLADATDLAIYRKDSAALSLRANKARDLAQSLKLNTDPMAGIESEEELSLVEQNIDLNSEMNALKAGILAKIVVKVTPPIPGKTLDAATLNEREGIGAAAGALLKEYFFDSSTEPEEETGTSETVSTETSVDTSEATENSDDTPPTS